MELCFSPSLYRYDDSGRIVEVLFATVRKHEVNEGFLVSGLLFPFNSLQRFPCGKSLWGLFLVLFLPKKFLEELGRISSTWPPSKSFPLFCLPCRDFRRRCMGGR